MARIVYSDISGQERSVPFGPDHPVVTIGRATDCTIRSNRKSVSRRHAEFRFNNGQFEVIDLNSSNGTYVIINDERKPVMGREPLAASDEVWCGDFILHFMQDEEDDIPTHAGAGVEFSGGSFDSDPYPANPQSGQQAPYGGDQYGAQDNRAPFQVDSNNGYDPTPQPDPYGSSIPDPYAAAPVAGAYGQGAEANVAWGATEPPPSLETLNREDATRDSGDIERLMAEKQSIEDLAARQASEIEDLTGHLESERRGTEELRNEVDALTQAAVSAAAGDPAADAEHRRVRDELEAVRDEKRRLQERLHTSLQLSERATDLEDELKKSTRRNLQLEGELDSALTRVSELEYQLANGAEAAEVSERQRENLLAKERDIEALEGEVERLQIDLQDAQDKHRSAEKLAGESERAIEGADALNRELERHKRLVEEFERRNRELQAEVDEVDSRIDAYKSTIASHESKLDDLESEIANYSSEADSLRTGRDAATSALEELRSAGDINDLKSEIEGLKQRLRLEQERSKGDQHLGAENAELKERSTELQARVEELQGEIEVLQVQFADAENAPPPGSAVEGLDPEVLDELRERVDMLERIVDAIERASLDALSTVDRVRLQSAIRDTEPKKSLDVLKSLLNES